MIQKIKKGLQRSKMIISDFVLKSYHFSFSYGIFSTAWWLGWYMPPLKRLCIWGFKHKDKYVKSYIYDRFCKIIKDCQTDKGEKAIRLLEDEYPIWVFWYQGFELAPPLVQACLENLRRKNRNVNIVDKNNIEQYITLPLYIKEKVDKGYITYTHYSDIIRVSLLAQYGGIWIDSTCFVTKEIPSKIKQLAFFSSKTLNKSPLPLWSNSRWCGWGMGSSYKAYPLFIFLKNILYQYWSKENSLIDYLLLDALIEIAYNENEIIHTDMNLLPENNLSRNRLWGLMSLPYNQDEYQNLISDTWLFKLSYKTKLRETTSSGQPTYYRKLLNLELN